MNLENGWYRQKHHRVWHYFKRGKTFMFSLCGQTVISRMLPIIGEQRGGKTCKRCAARAARMFVIRKWSAGQSGMGEG